MNAIRICAFILMCFLPVVGSNAGRVYTWTDERGVTHITETPPPPNAINRDVIEFVPRSEEETAARREEQQQSRRLEQKQQIVAEAKESRRKADQARAKAIELRAVADQLFQQSEEFKQKTSNTIRRWQVNRSTRMKLEQEAAEALKRAQAADQEAGQLERRAQEAEKRVREMLAQEESTDKKKSAVSAPQ